MPLMEPGPLIASGRAADVYAAGPGRVLRRYREAGVDATAEAAVMTHAAAAGYPVPTVYEVDGADLVMEQLSGPTMLDDLVTHPWRVSRHGRTLADLHTRLGAITAPADLRTPLGPGTSLLHLDLHPGNVMLTPRGPVVIDWTNAARGPAAADVADTWLLIACARPDGGAAIRMLATVARRLLVGSYLARVDELAAATLLGAAAIRRAADHHMSPAETGRMDALVRRRGT